MMLHTQYQALGYVVSDKKLVSEYNQEILQTQTADKSIAIGRATQPSRDTRKTN